MPSLTPPAADAAMVDWALWWAERGWLVFPVCSPAEGPHKHHGKPCERDLGKFPRTTNGKDAGTVDPAQIRAWWSRNPVANIGGRPPHGTFVVDIDGPTDVAFPETWEHTTGKGRHLLYRQPAKTVDQHRELWPNVDTRTHEKGYVVLPPSKHASGAVYTLASRAHPIEFPVELLPATPAKKVAGPKGGSEVIKLLTADRNSDLLGDTAMAVVGGYLARYLPDVEHWSAVMGAINLSLAEPLSEEAMRKKKGIYEKHQASVASQQAKDLSDEAQGWLFKRDEPDVGYLTPVEDKRKGTVEYMPVADFNLIAKGVVVSPNYGKRIFIVDCHLSDGSVITGQKIDTDTMIDLPRFKKWLARRGMNTFDNSRDPRKGTLGQRMIKLLESQDPEQLEARDHYGWCEETSALLTGQGEITTEGLREYTKVYPEDRLAANSPTDFRFDADLASARDWLSRVLALQSEQEAAKVGAWAMMLMLRGQWTGLMPGLLVQASAGTGKTRFFQLLFKLLGSTNEGETYTPAMMRDRLEGNLNGSLWLDDCELDPKQEQLMRTALTGGKMSHKIPGLEGWESTEKTMRASIVVTGEGVNWYRQKAYRDRFISLGFDKSVRTTDADKLVAEDVGRGSGALIMAILAEAERLPELAALREGVTERADQQRTTLRIGARILDAVLGTGHKWTRILDGWYLNDSETEAQGHASEGVLKMFPTLWARDHHPTHQGAGRQPRAVWWDVVRKCMWINTQLCEELWNQTQRNVSARERQMTSQQAIEKELQACDSPGTQQFITKALNGDKSTRKNYRYWALPNHYAQMVIQRANYHEIEDDE